MPGEPRDVVARARGAQLFVLCCFAGLVARLLFLRVWQHDRYRKAADENRIRMQILPAPRGIIRARDGSILAENRPAYRVTVVGGREGLAAARTEEIVRVLTAGPDGLDAEVVRSQLEGLGPRGAVRVVADASLPLVARLEEFRARYPEVRVQTDAKRYYRHGALAAHVIGRTAEISREELDAPGARVHYRPGDRVGRSGIERQYEALLRGEHGVQMVEVDATGNRVRVLDERENRDPVPGYDVFLTIDLELQMLADSLLEGRAAALVALDPRNGEVLALVSKPSYDLNLFTGGPLPAKEWAALRDDPRHPLIHRAIAGRYPPASTWKLVSILVGMAEGIAGPGTRFPVPCDGGYQFGRRRFRCWRRAGHGSTDAVGAMATSCDVWFYQLGSRLDLDRFMGMARSFGFGQPTGIDLAGESAGFLPSEEWFDRTYGPSGWTRAALLNLAIGQGEILVTPLQMAVFYGAVLRGGTRVRPHLLRYATLPGHPEMRREPEIVETRLPVDEAQVGFARKALTEVVWGAHGTGSAARVPGVKVGGKTGTAENPHGETHAWFVGAAPVDDPEIVVACIVEEGGHGGETAAPVVGAVLARHFSRAARVASQRGTGEEDGGVM